MELPALQTDVVASGIHAYVSARVSLAGRSFAEIFPIPFRAHLGILYIAGAYSIFCSVSNILVMAQRVEGDQIINTSFSDVNER